MSCRSVLVAATSLLVACPAGTRPPAAPRAGDTALRIRVAQAEARRAGGAGELIALATHGTKPERLLALRGLGRIGATADGTIATLVTALGDADADLVGAAAGALGVAASLDEGELGDAEAISRALVAALPRGGGLVVEALGRAGTAAAQPQLALALADPKLAELAGLALGRHGRRKLALAEPSRRALVAATASTEAAVRYAAVYALGREHQPPSDPAVVAALVGRLGDADGEIRAQAIAGLGRRKAVVAARSAGAGLDPLLVDADWRVAVEAVRALGEGDDGKDAIAAAIPRWYARLERGDATAAHVLIEGAKALATAGKRPAVAAALARLLATPRPASIPERTSGWIRCLAEVARVRAEDDPQLASLERCGLDDHLRLPLVAALISADVGSLEVRRAQLARLLGHGDPRVRAAGLGALPALWKAGDVTDHRNALVTLVAALASKDAVVASAAVDAAAAVYDAIGTGDASLLDAAVVRRAQAEPDPELASAALALIGTRRLVAGAEVCREALGSHPVRARAGARCLEALGEPAPKLAPAAMAPPPVDVAAVFGPALRWRITTARGDIVIALDPGAAPWAVATIVALTRKGFYDGVAFHRVVPNFVVQGGDPTETGTGGPGFAIPAEPSTLGHGTGYRAGGVGIADAGRGSGGSQWFVMHSRAPHLDGRYTWIGAVERGQAAADALVIGDPIVRATIELEPPAASAR